MINIQHLIVNLTFVEETQPTYNSHCALESMMNMFASAHMSACLNYLHLHNETIHWNLNKHLFHIVL